MIDGSSAEFSSRVQAKVLRTTVYVPEREIQIGIEVSKRVRILKADQARRALRHPSSARQCLR